ncbi:MAG: hypothetical protein LBV55_00850 [Acholeplasmatales bacterium]|jgi:hypothetical protein|nr:hypothetical protein [Acholeplasmatales bacterium]
MDVSVIFLLIASMAFKILIWGRPYWWFNFTLPNLLYIKMHIKNKFFLRFIIKKDIWCNSLVHLLFTLVLIIVLIPQTLYLLLYLLQIVPFIKLVLAIIDYTFFALFSVVMIFTWILHGHFARVQKKMIKNDVETYNALCKEYFGNLPIVLYQEKKNNKDKKKK